MLSINSLANMKSYVYIKTICIFTKLWLFPPLLAMSITDWG